MATPTGPPREKRVQSLRELIHDDTTLTARSALLSAGLAEFFCTAAFVFLATGSVTTGCHTADTAMASGAANATLAEVVPGACFLGSSNLLNIALAFGFAIFVLVYAAASFSGGHLNPAVTFAMLLAGRVSIIRAAVYIACQLVGAILGSALVLAVDPMGYQAALGAANKLNAWATTGNALGAEIILTAIFVFVVFAAVDQTRGARTAHLPVLAPLAIGIAVFLAHVVAIPIDGCSINPARSFGVAVVVNKSVVWHDQWIFWVGPLIGGGASGLLYEWCGYRAFIYSGPKDSAQRMPGASAAGPQEYTV
eukprot:GHRR01030984.1.p1 GENE.GHRR01030984.1~~GHRR01030984.1.p1  ORF type:complete len:309 (+),score=86.99 GHRR01030984.1:184-1110(+)